MTAALSNKASFNGPLNFQNPVGVLNPVARTRVPWHVKLLSREHVATWSRRLSAQNNVLPWTARLEGSITYRVSFKAVTTWPPLRSQLET